VRHLTADPQSPDLVRTSEGSAPISKAIIVADGDVHASTDLEPDLLGGDADGPPLVIAADGGALRAEAIGLRPDLVVGDIDSLAPATVERLRGAGIEIEVHRRAKDESDTELALRAAVTRGAQQLVLLGALGGLRPEHTLANVLLLCLPELAGREVRIVEGASSLRVIGGAGAATIEIHGRPGDLVSLLPLSEPVEGVTTNGLAYPLHDEPLHQGPSRGLSNEMTTDACTIATRTGRLVVIHTRGAEGATGES
jgi:thiamine pyrophosphokinase